jgi:hypothetical protein
MLTIDGSRRLWWARPPSDPTGVLGREIQFLSLRLELSREATKFFLRE